MQEKGYSWHIASIFVFGETAGSGLVALPHAIISLGLTGGIVCMLTLGLITLYTALLLSHNWILMKKHWSGDYVEHCRNPYPEMGKRAFGNVMGIITNFCCHLTAFGGGAVFSLLAAKTIGQLLQAIGVIVPTCTTLVVVALLLWPFIMLKSPMDFWQVSIVAALSTILAIVLILLGYYADFSTCFAAHHLPEPEYALASTSLATIIFAYGGHPCLPTIIHDMKNSEHFVRTCSIAYVTLLIAYAPVAIGGYSIYGNSVGDSIISSIQNDTIRLVIACMIAVHVLFSVLIIVNPFLQASEHFFRVKQEFGVGRFVVRTAAFLAIITASATIPNFGLFVSLVGGTTLPFLVLIFPVVFGISLETFDKMRQHGVKDELSLKMVLKYHNKMRFVADLAIIVIGVWILLHSLYGSAQELLATSSSPTTTSVTSCFRQWFLHNDSTVSRIETTSLIQCCGRFANVSVYPHHTCV